MLAFTAGVFCALAPNLIHDLFEMRFKPNDREAVRKVIKFLLEEGLLRFDGEGNLLVNQ